MAAVVLALTPWLLFMSAEEGAKASGAMDLVGKSVNFLILFGGLALLLRKPLAAMLAKRSADVRETLRLAEASKAEAAAKRADSVTRLSGLEDEIERMIGTAEEAARREKERIAALAADEAQRLRRFAEQAIDQQARAGVRELKAHAAERATSMARERIRSKLTPRDQASLIDKSIEKLARLHERPDAR
jgi:F-type H+-transporting ATPase subunit b